MALKARLKIQLYADKVVVAESEDEKLWRRVLAAIQGEGAPALGNEDNAADDDPPLGRESGKGIGGLAKEMGVSKSALQGACDPLDEAPYLHLDPRCWEAFKKNTPARGARSVSAIQLAGTLLCLWFRHSGIEGPPTQVQAQEVLGTIGLVDKNPSRGIRNCSWLQNRSGGIQINPAEMSTAYAVAKAFVSKQKIGTES